MLPPVTLKSTSQKAFNTVESAILKKGRVPNIVSVATDKNYILAARYCTDFENIHFQVYNKKTCQMTDNFVLASNHDGDTVSVSKYNAFQNNVMRPRDAVASPDKDMTFEEKVNARPVILKRIESILQAAADGLSKKS